MNLVFFNELEITISVSPSGDPQYPHRVECPQLKLSEDHTDPYEGIRSVLEACSVTADHLYTRGEFRSTLDAYAHQKKENLNATITK